jgi:hypothetical protein
MRAIVSIYTSQLGRRLVPFGIWRGNEFFAMIWIDKILKVSLSYLTGRQRAVLKMNAVFEGKHGIFVYL